MKPPHVPVQKPHYYKNTNSRYFSDAWDLNLIFILKTNRIYLFGHVRQIHFFQEKTF